MDLKTLWEGIDEELDAIEPASDRTQILNQKSRHPMQALRTGLKHKINWSLGIGGALFLAAAYFLLIPWDIPQPYALVGVLVFLLLVFALLGTIPMYRKFRQLPKDPLLDSDALTAMKHHLKISRDIFNIDKKFGYVVAIPSPFAGGMLAMISEGKTLEEIFTGYSLWFLIVMAVIVAPFTVLLGNWMNKIAFGKKIARLEGLIAELESEAPSGPSTE